MTILAGHIVVAYLHGAGFSGNDLIIGTAVAKAESGWNTNARLHTSQEDSRGVWQINLYAHPQYDGKKLYDPQYNAAAAKQVYNNSHHSWHPWTTYTRGTYKKYWNDAVKAYKDYLSLGGSSGESPANPGGGDGSGEAPAKAQPYGPYDPSVAIRNFAAHINTVSKSIHDTYEAMIRDM